MPGVRAQGINLNTADIVILYDSDWNPQVRKRFDPHGSFGISISRHAASIRSRGLYWLVLLCVRVCVHVDGSSSELHILPF